MNTTTARFWVMTNKGYARVKLRKGQSLTHVEGGPDDEGYSYTSTTWSFDGDKVALEWCTQAKDCDGPIYRGSTLSCPLRDLESGWQDPDSIIPYGAAPVYFPKWVEAAPSWQRDPVAEAAGY